MGSSRKRSVPQADLFASTSQLRSVVIARRKDFDELFNGFNRMRAVSYVTSVDLLLDFYDQRGYTELEIVVGENLSESYRQELAQRNIEVVERLAGLVEKETLRVYVPGHTIHTKLYMLERDGVARVIQTSANLTATAQEARRQTNYAWYIDLPTGHPLLAQLIKDYESHLQGCSLFMGDLRELLQKNEGRDRKQLIEAWLKGATITDEQDVEIRGIFHELTASLLEPDPNAATGKVTILHLPENELAKKRVERQLVPLRPISAGQNQLQVTKGSFIRYVYETHRVPLLLVSKDTKELLLGIGSSLETLSELPAIPDLVNQSLELVESYINTVDLAESANPIAAKTSMFEALLYMFFTPFANEYMRAKRARFGLMDTRGPRYLYIYGPSHNGKTTFLKFVLKLITGQMIEPLSPQYFTKTRIANAALTETAFPLVFDEFVPSAARGIDEVFKSYWERWWRPDYVSPQLVIASNTPRLKEWAKSRVKRIDFDVHFISTEASKERLNKLFDQDNRVFKWFSYLYLDALNGGEPASDDELLLSRKAMKQLYQHAGRPVPAFFPNEPIEKIYDPGRKDWQDLLYGIHKATAKDDGKRKLVTFAKDMQPWEINDYQSYLPQTVKYQRRGNTIIIENPKEFEKWLGQPELGRGLFSRLFKRS